jgi:single-strand DNA-binding protein
MNRIILSGHLGADPAQRTVAGKTITEFNLANTTGYGDKKTTNWFRVTVWHESTATYVQNYAKKGSYVVVQGELTLREYTDKNGATRLSAEIAVNRSEDLELPRATGPVPQSAAPAPQRSAPAPRPQAPSVPSPFGDDMPF